MQALVLIVVTTTFCGEFDTNNAAARVAQIAKEASAHAHSHAHGARESAFPMRGTPRTANQPLSQRGNSWELTPRPPASRIVPAAFDDDLSAGEVKHVQYRHESAFPGRGVDGLIGPRTNAAPRDPTAAFGQRMQPVPPANRRYRADDAQRRRSASNETPYTNVDERGPLELPVRTTRPRPSYLKPNSDSERLTRRDGLGLDGADPPASQRPQANPNSGLGYGAPRRQTYIPPSASTSRRDASAQPDPTMPMRPATSRPALDLPPIQPSATTRRPADSSLYGRSHEPPLITPSTRVQNAAELSIPRPTVVSPPATRYKQPTATTYQRPVAPTTQAPRQPLLAPTTQLPINSLGAHSPLPIASRGLGTPFAQRTFSIVLILFASIGLNLYLGLIAWDTYNRYQDLVGDMRHSVGAPRSERRLAEAY